MPASWSVVTRLAVLFALLAFGSAVSAQSAMELNRSGRWAEASEVAARAVADDASPVAARCESLYSLAYADTRLGRLEAVAGHLATFDEMCTGAAAGWVVAEVDKLRAEPAAPAPAVSAPDDWAVAEPSAADAAVLAQHRALCERSGADACLVVQGGRIVQEWVGPTYRDPMEAMSSTKSVAGLLAGMLVADGKLAADDPVARFVPEWTAGAQAGVTVRQLLTMTSGLLGSHVPRPPESTVSGVLDKDSLVFGLPLVDAPGAAWAYSNEGAYLLSPVLRRAAGEPLEEYAARRLFEPLGMGSTRLRVLPEGQPWTHATMWSTPRDLARIGQLMLQRGRWRGEQVVPEAWVEASVRPSQDLNPDYGLLWWLNVPGGFAARGAHNTNVYVFPDRDLVVVRMQAGPREGAAPYEPWAFLLFDKLGGPDLGGPAAPSPQPDSLLARQLALRVEADQAARNLMTLAFERGEQPSAADGALVSAVDSLNTAWLKGVVAERGWPTVSLVGEKGASDAWLLTQHADRDRPFQREALALMAVAVAQGEASGIDFAYLTDRVRLADGRPQVYGTQLDVADGQPRPFPIEDPEGVDARRAAVGLGPLADYVDEFRRHVLGGAPAAGGGQE